MINDERILYVSYSQIVVFDHELEKPFSMWTNQHVFQGFVWRSDSVSFRTPAEDGKYFVQVLVGNIKSCLSELSKDRIYVPFKVPSHERVEIGSISDSFIFKIPSNSYQLCCEFHNNSEGKNPKIKFIFEETEETFFFVERFDKCNLHQNDLLLTGVPA